MSVTFRTATINVKSNPEMRQASVVHDVRKASHQASVIGWQEIEPEASAPLALERVLQPLAAMLRQFDPGNLVTKFQAVAAAGDRR